MVSYKQAGVDIEAGDAASKAMYEAAKATWQNRKGLPGEVIVPFDDFSGLRYASVSGLKDVVLGFNFDGVGTKAEIAERLNKHDTLAFDLLAMVCDDAVVRGGEPVLAGNILDVNKLSAEVIKQLAAGMVKAAKEARVAVINGEIAELGHRVNGFGAHSYNWGASCLWFARKDRVITGKKIREGDKIIALKEEGFRSNGLSLARKIMENEFGANWHEKERKLAQQLLQPSRIYSAFVSDLFGGCNGEQLAELSGVVHVTGGGIPGKLGRVLKPSGLGAELNNLFTPCDAMLKLRELGKVSDEEAYRTWNMGQGMLLITRDEETVVAEAKKRRIEAKVAGEIAASKGIRIKANDAGLTF